MGFLRAGNMAAMANATPGQNDRQVAIAVGVGVAHPAAHHDHRIIKELCFFQLIE
jgi:hypothetical protein